MTEDEPVTLFESKGFSTRYSFGQGAPGVHELDLCLKLLQDAASTLVRLRKLRLLFSRKRTAAIAERG